jgi:hypothetical protein
VPFRPAAVAVGKPGEQTFTLDVNVPTGIALIRDSPGLEALWLGQVQAGGRARVGRGAFGTQEFEVVCDLEPDHVSVPFTEQRGRRKGFPFTQTPVPGLFSTAAMVRGEFIEDAHGSRMVLLSPQMESRRRGAAAALIVTLVILGLLTAGQWTAATMAAVALIFAGIRQRDRWHHARDRQRLLEGLVLEALSDHVVDGANSPFRRASLPSSVGNRE